MPNHHYKSQQSASLQELRVAQQELHSGSQTGRVYVRLSAGAIAFPMDRLVAKARIERHIKEERMDEN